MKEGQILLERENESMDMRRADLGEFLVKGGKVLLPAEGLVDADVLCVDGMIAKISQNISSIGTKTIDATGCLVLPGIVDVHGDAFERQIMPRPRTLFPLNIAMSETDRQLAVNGITTAYHGITVSWEPGLRSVDEAKRIIAAIDALEDIFLVDNRLHIRWETFAIDEAPEVISWFSRLKKPALAFNDHTTPSFSGARQELKLRGSAERAMLDLEDYKTLLEKKRNVACEIDSAIAVVAQIAQDKNIPLLSHDDDSAATRKTFRDMGISISEFPLNWETIEAAAKAGDMVVLGAPNVLRGGSHNGAISATEAIVRGQCSILASDYYYPAPCYAAFKLAAETDIHFEAAWNMVSAAPAQAMRLFDRGTISQDKRADIILVAEATQQVVGTISQGQAVFQTA